MTATQFVALLDKWGIPHRENRANWQNHNRAGHGEWGPVNGIGNHHTGGNDDKSGRDVLWNGYGDLPGPLCHAGIRADGSLLLNGWGRVNHFGLGDDDTLKAVINENYTGILVPNEANTDGNVHFYGFEWMYDGLSDPAIHYPKMYKTAVRLNAAICTHHNWKPESCIGHGEWQPGKWDPGYKLGHMMRMDTFRNHVEQAMAGGPILTVPKPTPTPVPTTPKSVVVKDGDTLWAMATKYLGNGDRWIEFVKSNPKVVRLQPGETLIIPNK